MDKPKISFSPPAPFSPQNLDTLLEKIAAIEREIIAIKKRLKEIETGVKTPEPIKVSTDVVAPAVSGPFFLENLDSGNMRVIDVVLDWVSFLLSKVGKEGLDDVLSYYVNIKWISPEIANLLKKYAEGLKIEASQGYMLPEDHVKSLDYISRIKEAMSCGLP